MIKVSNDLHSTETIAWKRFTIFLEYRAYVCKFPFVTHCPGMQFMVEEYSKCLIMLHWYIQGINHSKYVCIIQFESENRDFRVNVHNLLSHDAGSSRPEVVTFFATFPSFFSLISVICLTFLPVLNLFSAAREGDYFPPMCECTTSTRTD